MQQLQIGRYAMTGFDKVDLKVLEDVATAGWSDMAIFPTKDEPGIPFNYTVGLCEMDHPELLTMGLNHEQAHGLLGSAVDLVKSGTRFAPNTYSDEVLQKGMHVAYVEVLDVHGEFPLGMATRLFGDISALQVVWPDRNDRFPWHEDFDPKMESYQVLTGPWMGPMEVS